MNPMTQHHPGVEWVGVGGGYLCTKPKYRIIPHRSDCVVLVIDLPCFLCNFLLYQSHITTISTHLFVLDGFHASAAHRKSVCPRPKQQCLSHENHRLPDGNRGNRLHEAVN